MVQEWNLSKLEIIELYEKSQLKLHKINCKAKKEVSTGHNQSDRGCGSQWRHVVVTQRKLM